ncbi:MAG: hypothetical protein RBU25_17840 [Lentisphaeria bacterium]|jgi:hypothetical protein|nr:hypothetical protein [Lentisphaeria bacterium]
MTEKKKGWKWWQQAALGAGVLVFVLLCLVIGFRKPWIEPLPGVRTTMTRPFVRESSLGPDSAYFLMLEAIRPFAKPPPVPAATGPGDLFPPEPDPELGWLPPPEPEPEPVPAWDQDWSEALVKFRQFPWPADLPPPALPVQAEAMDAFGGMGMFGASYSQVLATPWTREQCEDILRLVRLYEPRVALLDRALAAPDPQMPTADSWNFSLDYLTNALRMARWLAVSGHYRAGTGDSAGAFRDFERILGLGNLVCRGGVCINYLVGIACDGMAADAAWVVASRERVPAPVLRDAACAFLAADDEAEPYVEAIRAEALLARNDTKEIYQNPELLYYLVTGHPIGSGKWSVVRYLNGLFPLAGSTPASTVRNLDACYQHLVVFAEKPCREATLTEYQTFYSRLACRHDLATLLFRTRDPFGRLLANKLIGPLEGYCFRTAHREAALRGMALFLAVRAYETEHGQPPETLDALVPDYLPRVPEDPFDGQPFRYLRRNVPGLPPEAWAVYSVGENFTDEGGTAHGAGTSTPDHGINPDFVWPSVDYPKAGEE